MQRVTWDGETLPFSIHSIQLTKRGFKIVFTEAARELAPNFNPQAVRLPDEELGQVLHAIVETAGEAEPDGGVPTDELRAHVAERLVSYKVPRSFELVDEPLRDDAGKVRRSALREARLGEP